MCIVYQSGSHQETKFAPDGSKVETSMNALCTEVWTEALRPEHQREEATTSL